MSPAKRFLICLLILCCAAVPPVQGGGLPKRFFKKTGSFLQKTPKSAARCGASGAAMLQKSLQKSIQTAAQEQSFTPYTPPAADGQIQKSVLALRENTETLYPELQFTASAFVIQEKYKGRTYLWGVTAAHVACLLQPHPAVETPEGLIPITFAAQGIPSGADLALFPIPPELEKYVTPLPVETDLPRAGDYNHSYGYFDDGFHVLANRKIQTLTPMRMVTSLEFHTTARGGACGGPLLNRRNRVTGIHIGSSSRRNVSFAVPAARLRQLLYAYHHPGKRVFPLRYNGHTVGGLRINEAVVRVTFLYHKEVQMDIFIKHADKNLHYARLEKLLPSQHADEVVVYVEAAPALPQYAAASTFYKLTWSARTGKTKKEGLARPPVPQT